MFKYIASILKTISPAQRVIALSIVLLSITLISIGPKITNSLTQDTEELKIKVASQKTEIVQLTARVDELNKQVIDNQRECTNQIVQKERELLIAIAEIEAEVLKTHKPVRNLERGRPTGSTGEEVMEMRMPEPLSTQPSNSKMLKMVKTLKKNLQNDLKDKQHD